MEFPKSYFYDEVREGFYISGMMKRSWAAQMEVLEEIDRVCRKYNIRWFADCGTLLGTVRHGGFIPWDDDLDICMLRDDYVKFHKYAVPELPERYVVLTYENEDYWQLMTRVVNRDKISFEKDELNKYHGFPFTAGIDVFVLDYLSPDPGQEELRRELVKSVLSVGNIPEIEGKNPPQAALETLRMIEEACQVKLERNNHLRRQLYQLGEKLSSMYPSEGAKEVVQISFWCSHHDHKFPIECYNGTVKLPFEKMMINAPAGYDQILRLVYGDYLRVFRNGGAHDYPLYQMQEDYMLKKIEDNNTYHYVYRKEDYDSTRAPKPMRLKQRALQYCDLLREINKHIVDTTEADLQQNLELLEQSQEGIICIGEEIEAQEGEDFNTVRCIEKYCEGLYEVSQVLCGESDEAIGHVLAGLNDLLERMETSIKDELLERKEVLFLPFRPDLWWTLDPLYQKAMAEENTTVIVMPLPFYDKDTSGSVGEMHYNVDDYPQYVRITEYGGYDIASRYPDVIYTQNAYDAYNYTYTLPAGYYTSELRKYTDKLVYVPHFRLGTYDPDDLRLRQTTRYFVKIPGLMYADEVVLESEEMRSLYLEELLDFCGEDSKGIWEAKLVVMNEGKKNTATEIPEQWKLMAFKENGDRKKTVLFLNAVCSLYQYKEQELLKIKEVLRLFEEKKEEILLIWRPHPAIGLSADLFERNLWLDYRKVVEDYRSAGWGILDESIDPQTAIDLADAYYGDPDPVMQRCRIAGKPVMIADAKIL